MSWNPALLPSERRKQTCGVWSVTIRVSDWAYNQPPGTPGAEPKSSTEIETLVRINEPTDGLPTLVLTDLNDQPLLPQNDPIALTVPAGVLTSLAKYHLRDPDSYAFVQGEIISQSSGFSFDPRRLSHVQSRDRPR